MLLTFAKLTLIAPPIGMAVMLVYLYGVLSRSIKNQLMLRAIMGTLFGIAAAMAMTAPVPLADGIIIDLRTLFVGIAAAYFGVLGGGIALAIGTAMRLDIGGTGMMLGVSGMIVSSIMGLLWGHYIKPSMKHDWQGQMILAGMISLSTGLAVFLPAEVRGGFFTVLAPLLTLTNLVGTVLLGQMMQRERALVAENDRLLNEVAIDPLTKLVNRKSAAASFAKLPALHDPALGQAMLCIDVDGFKQVNDTYGHICGDNILVVISDRLKACLRPDDIFSRISGDEFLIVVHGITSIQAQAVSERCRSAIADDQINAEGLAISVSISIGTVWTQKLMTFKTLRGRADDALYSAKAKGRNQVHFESDATNAPMPTAAVA